jgi:hypothetical protein
MMATSRAGDVCDILVSIEKPPASTADGERGSGKGSIAERDEYRVTTRRSRDEYRVSPTANRRRHCRRPAEERGEHRDIIAHGLRGCYQLRCGCHRWDAALLDDPLLNRGREKVAAEHERTSNRNNDQGDDNNEDSARGHGNLLPSDIDVPSASGAPE